MAPKVLDASALLLYLEKEPGYEKVKDALARASHAEPLFMNAVNWGEVRYILIREYGRAEADSIMELIETFPIEVDPADKDLAKQAAQFKAEDKLPYADSFAAASAKLRKAELLTGDREFKSVESDIKIVWL